MATLTEQLRELAATNASRIPPEIGKVMNQATSDLQHSGILGRTLKVGEKAPDFGLPDATGKLHTLAELRTRGPVVLAFYRGGWCPYCNLELRELQAHRGAFEARGAQLVAVSPQTPDASLSTAEKNALSFPVLSDVGHRVARQFGLVFTVPDALRPIYSQFGIDIPGSNGDTTFELPIPATYVIDRKGEIAYAFAEADYTKRADPLELLAALDQLR